VDYQELDVRITMDVKHLILVVFTENVLLVFLVVVNAVLILNVNLENVGLVLKEFVPPP